MVGGRAIGVLQCVNKLDSSIFIQEDADLLETFAGQAAIAIENARLFDMTDQQLALRVQELDTMQRIDQELNRTLRLENVVDITMDWAMRKSGASAGALLMRDRELGELRVALLWLPRQPLQGEARSSPTIGAWSGASSGPRSLR
jgi:GAF domain-containing protein